MDCGPAQPKPDVQAPLCRAGGGSKHWGATLCANRFVAIKYPTEDEAKLARDHAATRCPNFTDGRPIDWQVLELPPTLDSLPRRDEEAGWGMLGACRAAAPRQFA